MGGGLKVQSVNHTGRGLLSSLIYATRPIKEGIQSIGAGLKWGLITGAAGMASMFPVAFTYGLLIASNRTSDPYFLRGPEEYSGCVAIASAAVAGGVIASRLGMNAWSAVKESFSRKPDPKPIFSDKLAATIEEISESTRNIKVNGGFFQNLLLYGPGGTGKTMVAKTIAKNSGLSYIMLSGGDLPEYIKRGEHITELKKLFSSIKSPTVLFFDEMESIAKVRDKMQRSEELELLNALLNLTGTDSKLVMLIGATNMPTMIDPAMMTRFNYKQLVAPPGHKERVKILDEYIPRFFTKDERKKLLMPAVVDRIADQTDGLTGRALFKMLNAVQAKKMMTQDKTLRPEMISAAIEHFVEQERILESLKTGTMDTKMPEAKKKEPLPHSQSFVARIGSFFKADPAVSVKEGASTSGSISAGSLLGARS